MTTSQRHQFVALLGLVALTGFGSSAHAQACYGTPSRTNIAYEYGVVSLGQSNGIAAALVGGRTTLAVGARFGDVDDVSATEAALRFGFQFPAGKVQICPAIGLGYMRRSSEPAPDWNLTSNTASLRAGVGVGIEQEVFRGISVIPFIAARYQFDLVYAQLDAPNSEVEEAGDTLSGVDIEYGLMASWKMLFAGFSAQRNSDSGSRPYFARYMLGITLGGGRKD